MRDFTWEVFQKTGDIETYLLYRSFEDVDHEAEQSFDGQGELTSSEIDQQAH